MKDGRSPFFPQHNRQPEGILNEAGIACERFRSRSLVWEDSVVGKFLRPPLKAPLAAAKVARNREGKTERGARTNGTV